MIKHVVLIELLEYALRKTTAITYVDTHAGAGLFDLKSEHATKLDEWRQGVGRLRREDWPELGRYFEILEALNSAGGLVRYPGSPAIARHLLRSRDRAVFFELHPRDYAHLRDGVGLAMGFEVRPSDGFAGLVRLMPPPSRRAVVLIDPPYEVKADYGTVVDTLAAVYRKFTGGTYALWYPVVERARIDRLVEDLVESGLKDVQRFEIGVRPDGSGGMTAAGMVVVNPPWTLREKLQLVLARLAETLGENGKGFSTCEVLVGE